MTSGAGRYAKPSRTTGPQGLALVSTIIKLAHSLKLKVVAEGVETEEQSSLLRLLGCDEMQGFLIARLDPRCRRTSSPVGPTLRYSRIGPRRCRQQRRDGWRAAIHQRGAIGPEVPGSERIAALIRDMVRCYGVSLVRDRAVVLLDAVEFSLQSPLDQMAMLNSLAYSVNSAYAQLLSKDINIDFARTTTGDGFYIWNRAITAEANTELYKLMMMILADNAVARFAMTHPGLSRTRRRRWTR